MKLKIICALGFLALQATTAFAQSEMKEETKTAQLVSEINTYYERIKKEHETIVALNQKRIVKMRAEAIEKREKMAAEAQQMRLEALEKTKLSLDKTLKSLEVQRKKLEEELK